MKQVLFLCLVGVSFVAGKTTPSVFHPDDVISPLQSLQPGQVGNSQTLTDVNYNCETVDCNNCYYDLDDCTGCCGSYDVDCDTMTCNECDIMYCGECCCGYDHCDLEKYKNRVNRVRTIGKQGRFDLWASLEEAIPELIPAPNWGLIAGSTPGSVLPSPTTEKWNRFLIVGGSIFLGLGKN
ncbi:unnamed protein product [Nezara viridula]|uniref:Neuropeptide n=1 Tax=Nezara viridula TaxID=85310 RepID=A0A9P0HCW9_NEZVI|nr:unnamed protein product [Nezara viridula]